MKAHLSKVNSILFVTILVMAWTVCSPVRHSLASGTIEVCISGFSGGEVEIQCNTRSGGGGTPPAPLCTAPADFIKISTLQDFNNIRNNLSGKYFLCNNISLNGPTSPVAGTFTGTLDGNQKTISNFIITASPQSYWGLFEKSNGHIFNLTLANFHLNVSGDGHVGALAGELGGVVENLTLKNGTVSRTPESKGATGGLAGYLKSGQARFISAEGLRIVGGIFNTGGLFGMTQSSTMTDLTIRASVISGGSQIGGMIGLNGSQSSVVGSRTLVDVSVEQLATEAPNNGAFGGFVGVNVGIIHDSWSWAAVDKEQQNAQFYASYKGGFVGSNEGAITHSSASGTVLGKSAIGGFAGNNSGVIEFCAAHGSASGHSGVGGFTGDNMEGTVRNSYAMGTVLGEFFIGGFIGYNNGVSESCAAHGPVAGQTSIGGFTGYNVDGIIRNSYATGNVTQLTGPRSDLGRVGGFAGEHGKSLNGSTTLIEYSYSLGQVLVEVGVWGNGAFIGDSNNGAETRNSYYNRDINPGMASQGGEGRTTWEMTTVPRPLNTYLEWNFNNVWSQENGQYPQLQ